MQLAENVVVANRFRLVKLIGKGGMGSVWQAFDQNLNTDCAIKFIEGEHANKADAHTRFKREAQAAAQLRSPHIVQIFDHNIWDGVPYLAMELLEGDDLATRLARVVKIAPSDVAIIMTQVCRALGKAHERGIIHRDLKPDNIFLVRDDDHEIAKVLDFGIAKHTNGGFDVGSKTKTGSVLGTPVYMSPEQAQGKDVDVRSDLWSLAVIAFQALTGKLPFDSEALGDLFVKIIVSPIPIPSEVDRSVPPAFDAWWARAASRDPEQRFQTAKAFAESLGAALGQQTISGMRPELTSLPAVDSGAYGASLAGYGAANAATIADVPQTHVKPLGSLTFSGTDIPAGVPKKSNVGLIVGLSVGALLLIGVAVGGVFALRGGAKQANATTGPDPSVAASAASAPSANGSASAAIAAATDSPNGAPSASAASAPGASTNAATTASARPESSAVTMVTPKPTGANVGPAVKPKPGGQGGGGKQARPEADREAGSRLLSACFERVLFHPEDARRGRAGATRGVRVRARA
jgi:serine/threonine-protein kinase